MREKLATKYSHSTFLELNARFFPNCRSLILEIKLDIYLVKGLCFAFFSSVNLIMSIIEKLALTCFYELIILILVAVKLVVLAH